jgi:hypothetical protein
MLQKLPRHGLNIGGIRWYEKEKSIFKREIFLVAARGRWQTMRCS